MKNSLVHFKLMSKRSIETMKIIHLNMSYNQECLSLASKGRCRNEDEVNEHVKEDLKTLILEEEVDKDLQEEVMDNTTSHEDEEERTMIKGMCNATTMRNMAITVTNAKAIFSASIVENTDTITMNVEKSLQRKLKKVQILQGRNQLTKKH